MKNTVSVKKKLPALRSVDSDMERPLPVRQMMYLVSTWNVKV